MPTLSLTTTDGNELNFDLTADVHALGRQGENDLHVPDASVSSLHAELHRQRDGSYELIDLQSTNGTKINGEPIEKALLVGGESILFGQVQAFYTGDGGADASLASEEPGQSSPGNGNQIARPEEAAAQGEITTSSARPDDFDSSSPFGPKKSGKDTFSSVAVGVAIFSYAMCLVAMFLVLQMSA